MSVLFAVVLLTHKFQWFFDTSDLTLLEIENYRVFLI